MKFEMFLKCEYHNDYINGQILCNYSRNINSIAAYTDEKSGVVFVAGGHLEK